MKQDPAIPNQYFVCPQTGLHMDFKFYTDFGWCVAFPTAQNEADLEKVFDIKIPFPECPGRYREQIEMSYKDLEEQLDKC